MSQMANRAFAVPHPDGGVKTVVYDTADFGGLLGGTESERQQRFERLVRSRWLGEAAQVNWVDGNAVVKMSGAGHVKVQEYLSAFIDAGATSKTFDEFLDSVAKQPDAMLVCDVQLISPNADAYSDLEDAVQQYVSEHGGSLPWVIPFDHWEAILKEIDQNQPYRLAAPQVAMLNGLNVQVECGAQHPVGLKREDDGNLIPCKNWSGWKTHLLPFVREDGSYWLGLSFEHGAVVGKKELSQEQARKLGADGLAAVHSYRHIKSAATLKEGQVLVLPDFDISHGNGPARPTILTARVRRLSEKPSPDVVPSPSRMIGTGVDSEAGVEGEVVIDPILPVSGEAGPSEKSSGAATVVTETTQAEEPQTVGRFTLTKRSLGELWLSLSLFSRRRRGHPAD